MNLNQVTLPSVDLAASCLFYRKLGFTQIVDSVHYARFRCPKGDSTFSLSLTDKTVMPGVAIYFEHEALDEWVTTLKNKGIQFEQAPQDERYLWREARLKDPSGNKIILYWAGENRLKPPWAVEMGPL